MFPPCTKTSDIPASITNLEGRTHKGEAHCMVSSNLLWYSHVLSSYHWWQHGKKRGRNECALSLSLWEEVRVAASERKRRLSSLVNKYLWMLVHKLLQEQVHKFHLTLMENTEQSLPENTMKVSWDKMLLQILCVQVFKCIKHQKLAPTVRKTTHS